MIIGFDPGTVSGLAVVDMKGHLLFVTEFKGGVKQAIALLAKDFKPIIVASDKKKEIGVKKLAATFNAIEFYPKENLTLFEKSNLLKRNKLKNKQERNALSAALFAYNHHKKIILKVLKKEKEIFKMIITKEIKQVSEVFEKKEKTNDLLNKNINQKKHIRALEREVKMFDVILAEKNKEIRRLNEVKDNSGQKTIVTFSKEFKHEKEARERIEIKLSEAHQRLNKIEAQLKKFKKAPEDKKEDIRQKALRMIEEYKRRFRG